MTAAGSNETHKVKTMNIVQSTWEIWHKVWCWNIILMCKVLFTFICALYLITVFYIWNINNGYAKMGSLRFVISLDVTSVCILTYFTSTIDEEKMEMKWHICCNCCLKHFVQTIAHNELKYNEIKSKINAHKQALSHDQQAQEQDNPTPQPMCSFESNSKSNSKSTNASIATTISASSSMIASPRSTIHIRQSEYQKYVQEHEHLYGVKFEATTSKQHVLSDDKQDDDIINFKNKNMIGTWCIEDSNWSLIGSGAFSKVYKGIDYNFIDKNKHDSVFVAIKIIDNASQDQKKIMQVKWMANNEIHCLANISHKNIVKMLSYDLEATFNGKSVVSIVLEYTPNGNLAQLVGRFRGLPDMVARTYCQQIVVAANACHSQGVVHRDLKLENILLDFEFNAKICDFGLAKVS